MPGTQKKDPKYDWIGYERKHRLKVKRDDIVRLLDSTESREELIEKLMDFRCTFKSV